MRIPAFACTEGNCEIVSCWSQARFGCKFRKARTTLSISWQTYDSSPGLLALPPCIVDHINGPH
jgi:hypothetical protein